MKTSGHTGLIVVHSIVALHSELGSGTDGNGGGLVQGVLG
jgi:hypothetical protein